MSSTRRGKKEYTGGRSLVVSFFVCKNNKIEVAYLSESNKSAKKQNVFVDKVTYRVYTKH